jgi:ligand-binding sensor domain-containing protein
MKDSKSKIQLIFKIKQFMLYRFLFLTLFTVCFSDLKAQNDLKIGEWRSYLPYHFAIGVAQSEQETYYSTPWSLMSLHKKEFSTQFFDKSTGLSDVSPQIIQYAKNANRLLIAYANSNIDLMQADGTVENLPDIKNNSNIIGDKGIKNIAIFGTDAYFSCGFGLSKVDLKRKEFVFTTFTGVKVNATAVWNGALYMATDNGIYTVADDNRLNLPDFKVWTKLDNAKGFPNRYQSKALTVFNNQLLADVNDSLMQISTRQTPTRFYAGNDSFRIQYLTSEGANLLLGLYPTGGYNGKLLIFNKNNSLKTIQACVNRPLYAVEDAQERVWFADEYNGIRFTNGGAAGCNTWEFNSPIAPQCTDISISSDDKVYIPHGGLVGPNQNAYNPEGFESLIDGKWKQYNGGTFPILQAKDAHKDCLRTAVHPQSGKLYVGTYFGGLIEMEKEQIKNVFNETNSTIRGDAGFAGAKRVGGLAFDKNNNLWIANTAAANAIVVLKNDGQWRTMREVPYRQLFKVVVDNNNYKWFIVAGSGGGNGGLLVYDEGKSVDDTGDDRFRYLDNSLLPKDFQNAQINCAAVDLDGRVWVGTTSGVTYFECSDPFKDCVGRKVVSRLNGIDEYLLREKDVRAIAVDGANRKWFGTTSGIFVQSASGSDAVAKYNTENSPLLSNFITNMAINPNSGMVYIATDKGFMSLRGEATGGGLIHKPTATVFPNPVRPDYDGAIAINGLARDAYVKIADVNGTVVFETQALGGQAVWDGKGADGQRVTTGVYWVLSANHKNIEVADAIVAKILVIK